MTKEREDYGAGYVILVFVSVIIFITLFAGWVMNVYRFSKCDFRSPYKAEALYGVGLMFPPVGGILGWFDVADGVRND